MKNKFLSVIIALSMIVSCMATVALAENAFPDVLSPDHDWAATQIEEMTEVGIIKGYTDGTFKPDKAISKIEALLLFARVAGFSNSEYSAVADFAYDKYQYLLADAELGAYDSFKKELSFLLYKGVMGEDEIVEYLEDEQYLEDFPRVDAAILLSNLMDAEIKKVSASSLDFADKDKISDADATYIAYVVENGFMNGVQKDDGSIVFDAEGALSRAQVCVLLYRIMQNLDMTVEAGTVTDINVDGGVIDFENSDGNDKSYVIPEDAKVIVDGVDTGLDKVLDKSSVVVVRHGKNIYSVEFVSPESNVTVKGTVESFVSSSAYTKIAILPDGAKDTVTYYSNSEFKVTTNGVADTMKSLKKGDYVLVKLLGNEIVSVDRQSGTATVQGTLEKINLASPITITVLTADEITEEENIFDYEISDEVSVRRDGERATLRDILVGDNVVLTITRGVVTKIVATSTKGSAAGVVTQIKIASQSSITISSGGVEKEYPVSMSAEFIVGGTASEIYDLRLGTTVNLTLSGSTAVKVEQTATSTVITKVGTVESVSTAYGYINLQVITATGTVEEQIFPSKAGSTISAKIFNGETGKEMQLKNIEKGSIVNATGAYTNGAFVAKTIIVTPAQ